METEFEKRLTALINEYSKENDSDTPDFILARYLNAVLENFSAAIMDREQWYGRTQHVDDLHYKIPFNFDNTGNPVIIPTTTGGIIATATLQYNDGINYTVTAADIPTATPADYNPNIVVGIDSAANIPSDFTGTVNLIPIEIDEQEMIRRLEEKGYVINKK